MGIDLKLLPIEEVTSFSFSRNILQLTIRPDLFEAISAIEKRYGQPVKDGFTSHLRVNKNGDTVYGVTLKTGYDQQLMRVKVEHLLALSDHAGVTEYRQNKAAWAYLKELPGYQEVALYWD